MKFIEVPMLPIVIPFGVLVFLVLIWVLRSRGRVTFPRASVAAIVDTNAVSAATPIAALSPGIPPPFDPA